MVDSFFRTMGIVSHQSDSIAMNETGNNGRWSVVRNDSKSTSPLSQYVTEPSNLQSVNQDQSPETSFLQSDKSEDSSVDAYRSYFRSIPSEPALPNGQHTQDIRGIFSNRPLAGSTPSNLSRQSFLNCQSMTDISHLEYGTVPNSPAHSTNVLHLQNNDQQDASDCALREIQSNDNNEQRAHGPGCNTVSSSPRFHTPNEPDQAIDEKNGSTENLLPVADSKSLTSSEHAHENDISRQSASYDCSTSGNIMDFAKDLSSSSSLFDDADESHSSDHENVFNTTFMENAIAYFADQNANEFSISDLHADSSPSCNCCLCKLRDQNNNQNNVTFDFCVKKHPQMLRCQKFKSETLTICRTCMSSITLNSKTTKTEEFYCCIDSCSEILKSLPALGNHYLKHLGVKKFKCNVCDESYNTEGCLKTHARSHAFAKKKKHT